MPNAVAWDNRIVEYAPAVPLDQLLAHPMNPKIHPTAQTNAMRGILGEIGWLTALLVNLRTSHVLDGHDRIKAAMIDGQETAPVFYLDVPEEMEAYVLATFDPVGTLAATDSAILTDLLREVSSEDSAVQALLASLVTEPEQVLPGAGGDEFDATPGDGATRVQPGDLWAIGPHRLLCGDSTDPDAVAQVLAGDTPALLWADPPFSRDYASRGEKGECAATGSWEEILAAVALHTTLAPVWYVKLPWYDAVAAVPVLQPKTWIVWAKQGFGLGAGDFRPQHEMLLYSRAGGVCHAGADVGDVWNFAVPFRGRMLDVAETPVALIQQAIEFSSNPNGVVLDTFGGCGTSIIAGHRAGRRVRLIEVAAAKCDVILRRAEAEGIGPIARVQP